MAKIVLEMDVPAVSGHKGPLTLVYEDKKFKKGNDYDNIAHDRIKDIRAFRKDEESPCFVIKSVSGQIDDDFKTQVTFPILLGPRQILGEKRKYKYPLAYFDLILRSNPYESNNPLLLHIWDAGSDSPSIPPSVGENDEDKPLPLDQLDGFVGSIGVVESAKPPFNLIVNTILGDIFDMESTNAVLTHTDIENGESPGHKADFAARYVRVDQKRKFLALGFGFRIKQSTAGHFGIRLGGSSIKLPVDDQVRVSVFQSPLLSDSQPSARSTEWTIEISGLPTTAFVQLWNARVADAHLAALATVDAARELSFMPRLDDNNVSGTGRFALVWKIQQVDTTTSVFEGAPTFFGAYPAVTGGGFKATAIFPQLRGRNAQSYTRPVEVLFPGEALVDALYEDLTVGRARPFTIELKDRPELKTVKSKVHRDPAPPTKVRIGSLDLNLKANGLLAATIDVDLDPLASPLPGRIPHIRLDLQKLELADIAPGGQDPVTDDLLAQGVLSNEERAPGPNPTPDLKRRIDALSRTAPIVASPQSIQLPGSQILLEAQENTDSAHSRSLVLRLRNIVPTPATSRSGRAKSTIPSSPRSVVDSNRLRAVVIDPEPFLVAALEVPSVIDQATLDQTDGEFAIYRLSDIEGQEWSFARVAEGFDLYLPPQGIGEAMEKGRPWPPISGEVDANPSTIDYRFAPTARLWLVDREVVRRYGEAPWNLRRRFGTPADRTPGNEVAGLRAELLYGLAMQLRGDSLRVAEIGARIGALRTNLAAIESSANETKQGKVRRTVFNAFRARWAFIAKAYNTRVALLEPWREGTSSQFVAETGVDFLLRVSKDGNLPGGGTAADMRSPLDPSPSAPGLTGGATWGFESANVYTETIGKLRSTGGRIVAPGFTALGGFGKLTAEFANGKTRIGAEVTLGRTHRYVVERLGRIGLVWNRAKHVIVYERTVLPTLQFSGPGWPMHEGRPVLRKVEEYVELLQPERSFAEKDGPPIRRAMASASVFPTVKIPVDGRNWGRDIPEGWIVPLWRTNADPRVYPKPRVAMRMIATEDAAEATFDATAPFPERMWFFTSTRPEDSADTDAWAPVHGLDYFNTVRPIPQGAIASSTDNLDGQLPDDLVEDPIYAAVTIPIDTGGRRTNLGAGRVSQGGLGAVLESLTFMRAAPLPIDGSADAQRKLQAAQDTAQVQRMLALTRKQLESVPSRLEKIIRDVLSALPPPIDLKKKIKEAIDGEADRLTADIRKLLADAQSAVPKAGAPETWIASGVDACNAEAQLLRNAIGAITKAVVQAVDDAKAEGIKAADDWNSNRERALRQIETAFDLVQTATRPAWPSLTAIRDLVDASADDSLAKLKDSLGGEIDNECLRLKNAIDQVAATLEGATERANGFVDAVERTANGLVDRASSILARVPKAVRTSIKSDQALTSIRGDLDLRIGVARKDIANAAGDIAAIKGALNYLIDGKLIELSLPLPIFIPPVSLAALLKTKIYSVLDVAETNLNNFLNGAAANLSKTDQQYLKSIETVLKDAKKLQGTVAWRISGLLDELNKATQIPEVKKSINDAATDISKWLLGISQISDATLRNVTAQFCGVVTDVFAPAAATVDKVRQELLTQIASLGTAADQCISAAKIWADNLVDQLAGEADAMMRQAAQAIERRAAAFASESLGIADDLQRELTANIGRLANVPTFQNPESTLNLIRAAGQSPLVPNFKFNRERIAYIFDDFQEAVRTSPMAGLVNRVGEDLKALGLRVPTEWLSERILPADLQNFDISKIFPDLSGFKLDGLFRGIKLPQIAKDNIKVTHGFDRASQSAWVKATSDIPLDHSVDILSFGPIQLTILGGRFDAEADVVATLQGPPRTTANAEIVGDWQLGFGGLRLVTFERTRIAYDNTSGLTIDISPDRIRFDQAIQFLSDMIKSLGDPESGFVLELERDDGGRPIGVRAGLDLPLPPIAAGAFAASGIRLAASTALTVSDGTFAVETAAALGRTDEPFTLMIAFLNGGGYLTSHCLYKPQKNELTAYVSIAMVAGVGADFAFGPARGSVYLQVGAEATFVTSGGGGGLSVEVFLLIRGGVTVLSMITIGLVLRLGIRYNSGDGSADADGMLSVSIKISIFFTINVDVPIHYHLAGRKKRAFLARAADGATYLDLFA
ncbi:hypothetical protein [Bradyrhizobium oligotrophicum]|uniref:hypothetical protein n=1 Tax=Bradyrhizobium oligotrophicum TaxID=44255 RepID=UPI003EB6D1C5